MGGLRSRWGWCLVVEVGFGGSGWAMGGEVGLADLGVS